MKQFRVRVWSNYDNLCVVAGRRRRRLTLLCYNREQSHISYHLPHTGYPHSQMSSSGLLKTLSRSVKE